MVKPHSMRVADQEHEIANAPALAVASTPPSKPSSDTEPSRTHTEK
jgi:hypothetical protein